METSCGEFGERVDIGADVWVGGGAIILPGVRIESRAVVGAGGVVTREIPKGARGRKPVPRYSRDSGINSNTPRPAPCYANGRVLET